MASWGYRRRVQFCALALCAIPLFLSACGPGGGGGGGGGPSTSCDSRARVAALTRVEGRQIAGHVGSAADGPLSTFHYPLGVPNEDFVETIGNPVHPAFGVISPDGQYLATMVLTEGPNIVSVYPYYVKLGSHEVHRLPLPITLNVDGAYYNEWLRERSLAWVDDHTLLFFAGANTNTTIRDGSAGTQVFTYDVASERLDVLPDVTSAAGGIVRCGILYYQQLTPLTPFGPDGWLKGESYLHRYDLASHTELGAPIRLGETYGFGGWESHFDGPGWDVSSDGRLLVFQQTSVSAAADRLDMTSQFMAAQPDGSGAARILTPAAPTVNMLISIAPTNQLVAATDGNVDAYRDPTVLATSSAAMTIIGSVGAGSTAEFFTPIGTVLPAWTTGDSFYASQVSVGAFSGIGDTIYRYHFDGSPTGTGTSAFTSATYPATLQP